MKDLANIYKFDKKEHEEYVKDLWHDARPGMDGFAKELKEKIRAMDTPKVVALESFFGQGKTFFLTRFCEYLKGKDSDSDKEDKLSCIYLDLFESDCEPTPLLAIGRGILNEYYQDKSSSKRSKLGKKLKNLVKNSSVSFGLPCVQVQIPLNSLFSPEREKNVLDFKNELRRLISEKNGKLVLIVDELDRCDPHYAVQTLKIIKHFFDVEGLIIILASTEDQLDRICKHYYGFTPEKNKDKNSERYIGKFIDIKIAMDIRLFSLQAYKDLVEKHITIPVDYFNGTEKYKMDFIESVSNMLHNAKISIRELLKILNQWKEDVKRCGLRNEIFSSYFDLAEYVFSFYLKLKYGIDSDYLVETHKNPYEKALEIAKKLIS
ncbi:MAG: hypothetical protein LBS61_06270 [Endomicrobium sp.]|jgi:hypothetical protein|nr:hypothetical protein [Endomicrobium sp.]